MAKNPTNKAGAKFGTGYCDAQCPQDLKFINGEANILNWTSSGPDTGTGHYGACCTEMDIWEANSISTAYTAHACSSDGHMRCEGDDCGNDADNRYKGVCDKNGCDVQTFRLGNKNFFGPGGAIDSSKKVTVVTQFITEDGTDSGALKEIRRQYVQDGKIIETPELNVGGKTFNSISNDFCAAEVGLFKDNTNFLQKGGLKAMDAAMEKGMVLVMSLWDDHKVNMLWLDSTYPVGGTAPGDARGTCSTDSGKPDDLEKKQASSSVTFSNVRSGDIGSTTGGGPSPSPPSPPAPPSPSGCPGDSMSACIGLCPSDPTAFKACVASCEQRCKSEIVV
jgi:cellulose 1,4-beta-cellobiosidase